MSVACSPRMRLPVFLFGFVMGSICLLPQLAESQRRMIEDVQTIRGFEVPEFDRENRLQSRLSGELARLMPNGKVDITGLRVEFYDDERQVEMVVTAETCLYDQTTRNASSDAHIRIARDNMVITGRGFVWEAEEERFEIHDEAKVVFRDLPMVLEEEEDD